MKPVRLTAGARNDLVRLQAFLAEKSPRAGDRAVDAIEAALQTLSDFSDQGRRADQGGFRELVIRFGRDGYVAQYIATSAEVFILRIFHGRERRP